MLRSSQSIFTSLTEPSLQLLVISLMWKLTKFQSLQIEHKKYATVIYRTIQIKQYRINELLQKIRPYKFLEMTDKNWYYKHGDWPPWPWHGDSFIFEEEPRPYTKSIHQFDDLNCNMFLCVKRPSLTSEINWSFVNNNYCSVPTAMRVGTLDNVFCI